MGGLQGGQRADVLAKIAQARGAQSPQAVAEGQTLALPAQWAGRPAGPVTMDGSEAHPIRLRGVGGDLLLLPMERGSHSVAIEYVELP